MRIDDNRQTVRFLARGQSEIAVDREAIARGVADGFYERYLRFGDGRIDIG